MFSRNFHLGNNLFKHSIAPRLITTSSDYHRTRACAPPSQLPEILSNLLASLFQLSPDSSFMHQGRQLHAQITVNGVGHSNHLNSSILRMYVLYGSIANAAKLFFQMDTRFASPWTWMIRAFNMLGWFDFALLFYFKMLGCGTSPDKYTFPYVIKACSGLNDIRLGKFIHGNILHLGYDVDVYTGSCLIEFYINNDCIDDARHLFDKIPEKDVVLWNVMLTGYVERKDNYNAICLFKAMRISAMGPHPVTFIIILSLCASGRMIVLGSQLHTLVMKYGLEMDPSLANSLLSMYAKCLCMSDAHNLFDLIPKTDLVTWNAMIAGYVQNGMMGSASCLFHEMVDAGMKPDSVTFASFLPSLSESVSLAEGKEIHGYIFRHGIALDVYVKSALIDVYRKCRDMKMALGIFSQGLEVDVAVFSAMISGYVLNGMCADALEFFRAMIWDNIKPNSVAVASVLPACAGLVALKLGKELHCYVLKNALARCYVETAITDLYAKCGRLDLAGKFFARMIERDAVCWNSMITCHAQNSKPIEAIDLFRKMGMEDVKYNVVSISSALSACANLPGLRYGKEIHAYMLRNAFTSDVYSQSALIDMYSKCGKLDHGQSVFNMMEEKNEVSWNNIVAAYGIHGFLKESMTMFHKMLGAGINPDHVTFLALISACSHSGEVDKGISYFHLMTKDYGIDARMEHYACLVDMLGRAGRLNEAMWVVNGIPFGADAGIWGTLLGASRVHGNVDIAELASKHLFEIDPQNSGYYMLLANVHADAGKWDGVLETRRLMKERGVPKIPGYSWIEMNNCTHLFVAADSNHPATIQIYSLLKLLLEEMNKEGYFPRLHPPIHPLTDGL